MQHLTITLVQADLVWADPAANLDAFTRRIEAIDGPTDLIILPEMFTTGFHMVPRQVAEEMDGQAVQWLAAMSRERQADILGSLAIREGERFFNRLVWAKPDGRLLTYDKRHLLRMAGEDRVYTPGTARLLGTVKGWRIMPFICYDLRFPIWLRNLGNRYDLAVVVANWPRVRVSHWHALLAARAIENQCFVAGVNRTGSDGNGIAYPGGSMVLDPLGTPLLQAGSQPCVKTLTLDAAALEAWRRDFPAWQDADADLLVSGGGLEPPTDGGAD